MQTMTTDLAPSLPSKSWWITAAVLAIIPYVITVQYTTSRTVDGVTTTTHRNYAAIAVAAIAVLFLLRGLWALRSAPRDQRLMIGGWLGLVGGIAVWHGLSGFGMI
jgi:hypothetical protein